MQVFLLFFYYKKPFIKNAQTRRLVRISNGLAQSQPHGRHPSNINYLDSADHSALCALRLNCRGDARSLFAFFNGYITVGNICLCLAY